MKQPRVAPPTTAARVATWLKDWAFGPQPLIRLELVRIFAPLAILGFLSSRLLHADDWLGVTGFHVALHGDWRQPVGLPPTSNVTAWFLAGTLVVSWLMLSAGVVTRAAAATFAGLLAYVALADRLATFTVTKIGTMIALTLFLSPCGARWTLLGPRAKSPPTQVAGGSVRFLQLFVVVFYFASGVCKARGDWLKHPAVIWTHLHDSYQTGFAYLVGRLMPAPGWTVLQYVTLAFETLAPLWFAFRPTRRVALVYGVGMHLMIGLMFGPVIWFSLLMITLLVASFYSWPAASTATSKASSSS